MLSFPKINTVLTQGFRQLFKLFSKLIKGWHFVNTWFVFDIEVHSKWLYIPGLHRSDFSFSTYLSVVISLNVPHWSACLEVKIKVADCQLHNCFLLFFFVDF